MLYETMQREGSSKEIEWSEVVFLDLKRQMHPQSL